MPWRGDAVGAACSRLPEEKLGGKKTHQTHPLQVAFGSPFVGGENHDGKLPSLQSEAVLEPGRACEFPGSRCLAKVTGARPKRQIRGPREPLLLALLRCVAVAASEALLKVRLQNARSVRYQLPYANPAPCGIQAKAAGFGFFN